jgi:N-acetyl sugar amidotransferase
MEREALDVKYGLPRKVSYCSKCVINNQKPNTSIEYSNTDGKREFIGFDSKGECAACNYNELKKKIDWQKREEKLKRLLNKYRKNDGSYDVVVPVSGGKDSAYTAHVLKYRYGMNPLTVTWSPHIYTKVGWENLQNMIHIGGFDNILFTPNGKVHRLLTKLAFENLLHPFQPFVFGQKNIGPKISINYNIPLVMYGESNVEYGDSVDKEDEEMSENYFSSKNSLEDVFLGGISAAKLITDHKLNRKDLEPYLPVEPHKLGLL